MNKVNPELLKNAATVATCELLLLFLVLPLPLPLPPKLTLLMDNSISKERAPAASEAAAK